MGISGGTKPETFGECTVPWAGSWRFIGSGVDHTGDGLVLTWNPLVLNKLVEMDTTRAEHLLSERLNGYYVRCPLCQHVVAHISAEMSYTVVTRP